MHSLDHQVLQTLEQWINQGKNPWLCTIVATHGSSPRPVGSLMACDQQGSTVGSLSGGCVEDDLIERLLKNDYKQLPKTVEYGLNAEENEKLGLPCGGHLKVLIEQMSAEQSALLQKINHTLEQRGCIERSLSLETGGSELRAVQHFKKLEFDGQQMTQVYGPRYSLLLVGANQIAECLAQMASMMDYRIMITDPRPQKLNQLKAHVAKENIDYQCIEGMPDDVVRDFANDPFSIVITLTHDPRIDDMALMEALTLDLFYVGALGSVRTTEKRLSRLKQLDLSEQQIARLQAPVGLAIGSKTAPEIAVSILAQLTQLRRLAEKQRSNQT